MLYPSELQPLVTRLLHFYEDARLGRSVCLRPALARDFALTAIAIAIIAFALADVAREVFRARHWLPRRWIKKRIYSGRASRCRRV